MTKAQKVAVKIAEDEIQSILRTLTVNIGAVIDSVRVFTRDGTCRTEIFTSLD